MHSYDKNTHTVAYPDIEQLETGFEQLVILNRGMVLGYPASDVGSVCC